MLISASHLIGTPILSVQASGPIAAVADFVVEPNSLKILGFFTNLRTAANLLDAKSIREFSAYGFVIDSADEFVEKDDVIKLSQAIDLNFNPIGLKVETKKGSKLGRVADFTVTSEDFTLQQLIVRRPLMKSFLDPELTIPRREIVEITDDKIIVKDEEKTIKRKAETEDFIPNFVNPFRKSEPAHAKDQN